MNLQFTELKMNNYETNEKKIKVGVATTKAEKEEIYQLRYQIYVDEMGKKPFFLVDHGRNMIFDELDKWSVLMYVEADSKIVGTFRLTIGAAKKFPVDIQNIFSMEKFQSFGGGGKIQNQLLSTKLAIIPEYRSSQALYLLVAEAYKICRDEQIQFSFGGCSPYLVPLYEKLGFWRFPRTFADPGYGVLVPLIMVLEDIEHLQLVRSPFLRIARKRHNDQEAAKWFLREFPNVANVINSQLISKEALWEYVHNRLGQSPLQAIHLLNGLNEEDAKSLLHIGTIFHCAPGDYIVNRGEIAKELYILLSGRLKVLSEVRISERVPGECFGRSGLITPQVQVGDIYTTTHSEVMVIAQQSFEKLCRSHPEIVAKVLDNMRSQES